MVTTRGKKIDFTAHCSDGEIDVEQPEKPAPKRRKTKKSDSADGDTGFVPSSSSVKGKDKATSDQNQLITRRSGKGGKLRDLMNMPIDIFAEVCFYLGPFDLRRLALTSKRLWDILMTKEARHIWKTALASATDLPECPTDLNEPQYVCLLYSSECYTIGCTSRGTKVDWFHRVRFCATCFEVKMTNEWDLTYDSGKLDLGLRQDTLLQIQDYFDMMDDGSIFRSRKLSKTKERYYHVEALKKAGHDYEALSRDAVRDYLTLLEEKRNYRKKTGSAMSRWSGNQVALRAGDIAAEKNARFESIKSKLLEMGWIEKDFPMRNKAFKDLVMKDQKLTPKVWQNIKPKLEPLLEASRAQRLEGEKMMRLMKRQTTIHKLLRQVVREVMDLPYEHPELKSWVRGIGALFALPSVKLLFETDTETVTEERWIEVEPEVRLTALKWWRDSLQQLVGHTENGVAALPKETEREAHGEANLELETEEAITSSISALERKLSLVTSAFCCTGSICKRIYWFPDLLRHVSAHSCYSMAEVSKQIRHLQPERRDLLMQLLRNLKFDPEAVQMSDLAVNDQNAKTFLCTRCDERIAGYMDFSELMEHYLGVRVWFDNVTKAVQTSPETCYPSRAVNSELPKIVNDHDWVSCDAPLARRDDEETKEAVFKLQSDFRKEALTDPRCDTKGIGGEDLERNSWREVRRGCRLCPPNFAPRPCGTAKIELHIRSKHEKEPDLEADTTLDLSYPTYACPL